MKFDKALLASEIAGQINAENIASGLIAQEKKERDRIHEAHVIKTCEPFLAKLGDITLKCHLTEDTFEHKMAPYNWGYVINVCLEFNECSWISRRRWQEDEARYWLIHTLNKMGAVILD